MSSKFCTLVRRGIVKELIASGIYSCGKRHYKHRTVERFYLEFVGYQGGNIDHDTAETIRYLGNIFFSDRYYRKDRIISFRPSRRDSGFYLIVGKVSSYQRIIDLVESLCGFIVETDKVDPTDSLMKPDLLGAKMCAADYHVLLHKLVHL